MKFIHVVILQKLSLGFITNGYNNVIVLQYKIKCIYKFCGFLFLFFFFKWKISLHLLLQGYSHIEEFIVTQYPLQDTIEDFWRMVWEKNSTTIVCLYTPEGDVSITATSLFFNALSVMVPVVY